MDKMDRIMEITNRYLERFNAARAACPPPNFINSPSVQIHTSPKSPISPISPYKSVGKRDFSTGKNY